MDWFFWIIFLGCILFIVWMIRKGYKNRGEMD